MKPPRANHHPHSKRKCRCAPRSAPGFGQLFVLGLCALGLSFVGGCNYIGAAAQIVGPPPVNPLYVPAKTPMLVLADTSAHADPLDAEQLERFVIAELIRHDVAPLADGEKIYGMRSADPQRFRRMSIASIGRFAGAAQVLYMTTQIDAGHLAPGVEMVKGYGVATCRIVDVGSGETLWPLESSGYTVSYETRYRPTTGSSGANLRHGIQQALADRIVKAFYRHQPDDSIQE